MELTLLLLIFIHYQNINLRRQLSDILLFEDDHVDTLTTTSTFNPIKSKPWAQTTPESPDKMAASLEK